MYPTNHSATIFIVTLFFLFSIGSNVICASDHAPTSPTPKAHLHTPEIIGGEEASSDDWPWMVAVVRADREDSFAAQYCGGALIAPNWVITAAHCTMRGAEFKEPSDIHILFGDHQLTSTEAGRVAVREIVRHPEHLTTVSGNADVALLRLESALTLPLLRMATDEDTPLVSGTMSTVLGWGHTGIQRRVDVLRQVSLPLILSSECQGAYSDEGYSITENMICAGQEEGGKDACFGDSGGPLLIEDEAHGEWIQIGIVSWGKGCAEAGAPGVYTQVRPYSEWIYQQLVAAAPTDPEEDPIEPVDDQPTAPVHQSEVVASTIYMPMTMR